MEKVEFNIKMKLQGLLVAQLKETAQTETPACDMASLHKKPDLVSHIAHHRIEQMKEEEASMAKAQAGRNSHSRCIPGNSTATITVTTITSVFASLQ
eukprot:11849405-Alexandrium_andersonii.AAC.1